MGIDSIIRKIGMFALAGLTALAVGCMPLRKPYIESRLGAVIPVSTDQGDDPAVEEKNDYGANVMIGVTYGINGKADGSLKERLGLEFSLDYFKTSAGYIETNSLLLGVNATYPLRTKNPSLYLTGGIVSLSEFSTIDIPPPFDVHDKKSDTNIGVCFGANLRFDAKGREDVGVKFSYIILPGSDNFKGLIVLTASYRF